MTHRCHAHACNVSVPPRLLFCAKHWRMTPKPLQDEIWRTYRRGQEVDKDPSEAYMAAHHEAVAAVAEAEGHFDVAGQHRVVAASHRGGS